MFRGDRVGDTSPHRHRHRHYRQTSSPRPPPPPILFHLLQLTIISAQDLKPTCNKTRAYAEAWVDADYKLQTQIDRIGGTNPNWNDKFIFRVNSDFLCSNTAAVTIDIKRAPLMFLQPDPIIGTARLILSSVNPSPITQFVAIQVRRPKSLRLQGILNLGVAMCLEVEAAREVFVGQLMSSRRGEGSDRGARSRELEKSRKVGMSVVDKERKALQWKLEKWRTEISPATVDPHSKLERKEEAEERFFGCFSSARRR